MKLIKKTVSCKDKIPEVKLLYLCIKDKLSSDLDTNATGMDLATASIRSINTPTANALTAATIWFSVTDDKKSPMEVSAPVNRIIPNMLPIRVSKKKKKKKEIMAV